MKTKTVYRVKRKNTNEYLSYVDTKKQRLCFSQAMKVFESQDSIYTALYHFPTDVLENLEIIEVEVREEIKSVYSLADSQAQWKFKVKQFSQDKKSSTSELLAKLEERAVLKDFAFIVEMKNEHNTIRAATKSFKDLLSHMKEINLTNRSKVRYVGPKLQAGAAFAFKEHEDVLRFKLAFGEQIQTTIDLKELN